MRKTFSVVLLAVAFAAGLAPFPHAEATGWTRVVLNGRMVPVSFNDGDSFRVQSGPFSGSQCRLGGFNTLESFGPAHQWGTWHPYELYVIAKLATRNARRGTWHCTTEGRRDGYGRLLLDCPDLAVSQISLGLAMAYQVDDTPSRPEYIRAQREAIAARRGMWAHGVPDYVMTSVHSASEDPTREHYNRLISTHDGHSESRRHRETYAECEWVCNTEIRADEDAVREAARALRSDPALAPLLADLPNFHLMEFARRYARLGELPAYVPEAARALVEARLQAMRSAGQLGTTRRERGSCMLFVPFDRWFGGSRAACLRDHGTLPPGLLLPRH
jgi:endonuclease YncB( thermonuclease family)